LLEQSQQLQKVKDNVTVRFKIELRSSQCKTY